MRSFLVISLVVVLTTATAIAAPPASAASSGLLVQARRLVAMPYDAFLAVKATAPVAPFDWSFGEGEEHDDPHLSGAITGSHPPTDRCRGQRLRRPRPPGRIPSDVQSLGGLAEPLAGD